MSIELKPVDIAGLRTANNIFAAPLAGYTNAVFRQICLEAGAGLTFTEMVSAKGLCYGSEKTEELLAVMPQYDGIKACQIFGKEPYYMRKACESAALAPFDIIDINMGCPVPKIYKNGEGSALMNNLPLVADIISECKKSGKIITVKFRTGLDGDNVICTEFAKVCEGAGADMLTIHGRTRDKFYSGEVNFGAIAAAKKAVRIPVIANGGVFSFADAERLLSETGADGVAVGRGAIYEPWIFAEITGKPVPDKRKIIEFQLENTKKLFGERFACVFMRKMVAFYIKGMPNSASLKKILFACPDCDALESVIDGVDFDCDVDKRA